MHFKRKQLNTESIQVTDVSHWIECSSEVVGFPSIPKAKAETSAIGIQTEEITTKDQETAAASKRDVQIQTVPIIEAEPARAFQSQPYPPSLFAFFTRVTDLMCVELRKRSRYGGNDLDQLGAKSKSGKNFRFDALRSKAATVMHRLQSSTVPAGFKAKSVSWNPSGTQLAVGHFYGSTHFGWCRHQSVPVTVWSLVPNILKNGPLHEIPFDSCASTVKFHPSLGNLIAVGFYSGEVALLDFSGMDKEPQLADNSKSLFPSEGNSRDSRSGLDADADGAARRATQTSRYEFKHKETFVIVDGSCHAQEVTSLQWIHCTQSETKFLVSRNSSPSHYFIVSASVDGFIGLWSIDKYTSRVFLERRYVILATSVPDSLKQGNLSQFSCIKQLGVQTLECCKRGEPTQFICSTTGSFLFAGSLMSDIEIGVEFTTSQMNISTIYSPQPRFLFQEREYISKINYSPYHADLYAYVTLYGRMAIRDLRNEYEANVELYLEKDKPASDFHWSKRPMLFGVSVENSLFLYDLTIHSSEPVLRIDNDTPLCALAFNMEEPQYVAATDCSARLVIWKLPNEVALTDFAEMVQFTEFAEAHTRNATDAADLDAASDAKAVNSESSGDEASEESENPRKSAEAEGMNSDSDTDKNSAHAISNEAKNSGEVQELTPSEIAEIESERSQFYGNPMPFAELNISGNDNSSVHSSTSLEKILNLCTDSNLKPQSMRPVIIPSILCTWSPAHEMVNMSDASVSNSNKDGDSSHNQSRDDYETIVSKETHPPKSASRNNGSRSSKNVVKGNKHDDTTRRKKSSSNDKGNEPQLGSTVAEVQVHSALNDTDSNTNDGEVEELLVDEAALKASSDAESVEIDSNPNSSSNAEDTVIETKFQT